MMKPLLGAIMLLALTACSQSSSSGATSSASSGSGGGGGGAASVCATDPRAMPYAVGLSQASMDGALHIAFVDADPAPPSKGYNTWTLKLTDAQGAAITGASFAVKTLMPDHGHGSSLTPVVKPMGGEGMYEVSNLELFMPGIWQVTFTVTPAMGTVESVMFTFCVDG